MHSNLTLCDVRLFFFFFFNDTATTEIYTLSLHDALPIYHAVSWRWWVGWHRLWTGPRWRHATGLCRWARSEEHTSELQSRENLVCRLLLEKKKKKNKFSSSSLNTKIM